MKKSFVLFLFLLINNSVFAVNKVVVKIDNLPDRKITNCIGFNASIFFDRLNIAFNSCEKPSFPNECIINSAENEVLELWNNSPFKVELQKLLYKGIITASGYQIRGIPIYIKESNEKVYGVLNFNPDGKIVNFHLSMEEEAYKKILASQRGQSKKNIKNVELRMRMIMDFVENFRTAYCRRDVDLISKMYSDDVMIITGYVYSSEANDGRSYGLSKEKIEYNLYSKNEYLQNLKSVFAKNRFISVDFNDVEVMQHSRFNNIFGVTLMQKWRSSSYNDDGWLFMVVEFYGIDKMLIHIRTWQPYMLNNIRLPKDEVYQLGNFDFE